MNKALEKIKNLPMKEQYKSDCNGGFTYCTVNDICGKEIKTIESSLKEYEMEHTLRVRLENANYELVRENECLKTELLGQSQELNVKNQALEIIKNKGIDIDILRWSNTVAEYNAKARACIGYTQEEYELVVGVIL